MDHIRISRIGIFAYHGLHPEENRLGQRFYISLDCGLDLKPAGTADDFEMTVCYATLAERVQEVAVSRQFKTLEGLAEAIAAECLREFARLQSITVTVDKPGAPVPAILDGISVAITRNRHA
jgi:dihydroneopterin aldolase